MKRPKLSFARGAGDSYGLGSPTIFGKTLAPSHEPLSYDAQRWSQLARFPEEQRFLELFSDHGYHRAQ